MGGVLQARGMEAVPRQTHAGVDGVQCQGGGCWRRSCWTREDEFKATLLHQMLKVSFNNLFYSVLVFNNQLNKLIHSSISIKVERGGRNILAVAGSLNVSFSVSTNFFHIWLYLGIFNLSPPLKEALVMMILVQIIYLKLQDSTLIMILIINATLALGFLGLVLIINQNIWRETFEDNIEDAIK